MRQGKPIRKKYLENLEENEREKQFSKLKNKQLPPLLANKIGKVKGQR